LHCQIFNKNIKNSPATFLPAAYSPHGMDAANFYDVVAASPPGILREKSVIPVGNFDVRWSERIWFHQLHSVLDGIYFGHIIRLDDLDIIK